MKGKVSIYTDMPGVAKFRNRVSKPSKDLTSKLREILADVVCDVINHSTLEIRAKFIEKVAGLGLEYKSKAHASAVASVLNNFFDVVAAPNAETLSAICGSDESEDAECEETEGDVVAEEPDTPEASNPSDDDFTD